MKITKKERKIQRDLVLWDGHLSKTGNIAVTHKGQNKDYAEWKHRLATESGLKCSPVTKFDNNGYGAYRFSTGSTKYTKHLRRILYTPQKDWYNRKILDKMDEKSLAIWYMDDGSISSQKRDGKVVRSILTISTCTSKENNQILIDYLQERWGVKFGQRKMKNSYALVCSTREARKFISIVEETVREVPSMIYKLNVKP